MITAIAECQSVRQTVAALAPLFRYPDPACLDRLKEAVRALRDFSEEAGRTLANFERELERLSFAEIEMAYTAAFDLVPCCSPYLGVHLFGEEARERARMMLGLRSVYQRRGTPSDPAELPDHIAEVLEFAPWFREEEWRELLELVLVPALEKMDALLGTGANPYRHLVRTLLVVSRVGTSPGGQP